ncbi:Mur ligase family protein [Acidovorax sp. M2(2025)]|uniref:Mur ligase family protein n=1 Tax=Acidovorax sp. M2(2025) TaxID=3411355 RepID=UPI003BF58698
MNTDDTLPPGATAVPAPLPPAAGLAAPVRAAEPQPVPAEPPSVQDGSVPAAAVDTGVAADVVAQQDPGPSPAEPAPAPAAAAGKPAWDPEKPPAVSAAKAAADFVAQIFADVNAPEAPAAEPPEPAADAPAADAPQAPEPPAASATDVLAQLLQGQRVLILGLGASGLAMARWCVRCGADVTVADTREAPPQRGVLAQELPQVRLVCGAFDAGLVEGQALDAVFRSPGLSPAAIAPVVIAASACGTSVGGELDLFSSALHALRVSQGYTPAVLAITGTNGKTTVTSLTGQLIERSGRRVAVAGNIGPTLLDTLAQHVDAGLLPEVWVLELSSFQLDGVRSGEGGFEPTAAAVLNVTQDHLDWHGDMAAYAAAKARIFGQGALMVLNRDDAEVMRMLPPPGRPKAAAAPLGGSAAHAVASVGAAQPVPPPAKVKLQKPQLRPHVTFGADLPQRPGDFGIEVISGMPWLVRAMDGDETRKRGRSDAVEDLHLQRLMPSDALRIRGRHNALNALAALALASAAGCTLAPQLYGLREYRGEPHRVEPVAIVQGVEYFDDSKGTNVGATVAALSGLGAERRIVVILGGEGKGQDFTPLAAPVARHARAVVLIGRDAPQIRAALADCGVPLVDATTLPEAVGLAARRAHAGDAVLLSPACASLDMFRDYAHRAQVFCDAVRELADEAGAPAQGGMA